MKTKLIILLLTLPLLASAQYDFTGTWEGVLTQGTGGYAPEYAVKLHIEQDGLKITGRTFVEVGEIYAEMEFKGRLIGNKAIHLEETKLLRNYKYEHMEWCYKSADLFLILNGEEAKLEGPWRGVTEGESECIPGKIIVKKTSPRA
jgi:hypothetical protein